jgi:hypothetical protein
MCWCEFCPSLSGDFHHEISSRPCRIYSGHNAVYIHSQYWPLRIAQHDHSNFPSCQVLLAADIFVGIDQDFKSGILRCFEQVTVLEGVPTPLRGGVHSVSPGKFANWDRSGFVQENQHQRLSVDEGYRPDFGQRIR